MSDSRAEFEAWLKDVHDLESNWIEERNCFEDFPAHLAYKAWQASRAQPERKLTDAEIRELAHTHLNGTGDHCIINFARALLAAQPAAELDHGDTVLRVQEELGITTTGWVSPDVILLRIRKALEAQPAAATPEEIYQLREQNAHLVALFDAAKNLIKINGRHNTSIGYHRLVTAFDAASEDEPPDAQAQDDGEKR